MEEINLLTSEEIDTHWWEIISLLEGTEWLLELYEASDLYELVKTGQFQVWALRDRFLCGIVLTRIQRFPKKTILQVLGLKGANYSKFDEQLQEKIEFLAQTVGATELHTVVRPGLERVLARRGAQRVAIHLKREIGQRRIH